MVSAIVGSAVMDCKDAAICGSIWVPKITMIGKRKTEEIAQPGNFWLIAIFVTASLCHAFQS